MADRVKLLPALIAALLLLFGLKAANVWDGVAAIGGPPALAQSALDALVLQGVEEDAAEGDSADDMRDSEEGSPVETLPARDLSPTERAVLENLAARRAALSERENDLEVREKLLIAAETRIDERITELKSIEAHIADLLLQRDEQEEAQIRSLVKVYERMKPKDAARIFETLDPDIQLEVAARMKEQSIAGILSAMTAAKAQDLTERLAVRHTLPEEFSAGGAGE